MEDLAPGMRFYPTEEELVSFYLHHKLEGKKDELDRLINRVVPVLDIYEFSPWDLPQLSGDYSREDPEQWFFFIPRQESEARGGRPRRLTTVGYWKATGSPGFVYSSDNRSIGVKRTMVFYKGRAPTGRKTDWKMNEYKAIEGEPPSSSSGAQPRLREEFNLCRVYKKSKCLRSFDRRPLAFEIGEQRVQQGGHGGARTILNYQNPPLIMEKRISSSESSSSSTDHHSYLSQIIGEGSNINIMPMAIDNNPLWDLDPLNNWYYGGDQYYI